MSAISTYEQALGLWGTLPSEIFVNEPGPDSPIPTAVRYRDSHDVREVYRTELDDRGRLLCVTLGNTATESLSREWTGEHTFVDVMEDGRQRRVEDGPRGQLIVIGPGDNLNELWTVEPEEPGDHSFQHAQGIRAECGMPHTYVAEFGPDGRLIVEQEWSTAEFEEDEPPRKYRKWTYTDSGNLVTVAEFHNGVEGRRPAHYVEDYRRVGSATLEIVGSYPQGQSAGLLGKTQTRVYDFCGRVEQISGTNVYPDTGVKYYEMELSYE